MIEIRPIPDLRERMLALANAEIRLDMCEWADMYTATHEHPCGTVSCLAGLAVSAHPDGLRILDAFNSELDDDYESSDDPETVALEAIHSGSVEDAATAIMKACGVEPPRFLDTAGINCNARARVWLETGVHPEFGGVTA